MEDEASISAYPKWLSILLLLFAATGFLSNMLVCITILKAKFLHDVTHYLILNLAISDGLCCLMFGLNMFLDLLEYPNNDTSEVAQIVYCHLIFGNYLFQSFAYTSAYNLVIISLERYVGIVSPLRYARICTKRNIWLAILLAWVLGFCAYLVHLIGLEYTESGATHNDRCLPTHDWYGHLWPLIAGFIVPLITMIWAYVQIIKALRRSAQNQNVSVQVRESQEARKRVVHLMLIVTITYTILYIPTQPAYMVIVKAGESFDLSPLGTLLIDLLNRIPVLLNSVVNPFIYAFKYKKFRRGMQETICRCTRSRVVLSDLLHINRQSPVPSLALRLQRVEGTFDPQEYCFNQCIQSDVEH